MSELNREKLVKDSSLNINLKNVTEIKSLTTSNIEVYAGTNKAILMDLNGDQSFTDFIYKTYSIDLAIKNYPVICDKLRQYANDYCGKGLAASVAASKGSWGYNHYWSGTKTSSNNSNTLTIPLTGSYTVSVILVKEPATEASKGGYILYKNNKEYYRNFENGKQMLFSKGDRVYLYAYNEFYENTRGGSQYKTNKVGIEIKFTFDESNFLNSGTGIF